MKRLFTALALMCLAAVPMLAQQGSWEIVRADYGSRNNWVDVTDRVRSLVQNNALNFRVDAAALGTSQRQGRSSLRMELRDASGNTRQITYRANQRVRLQVNNSYQSGLRVNHATYAYGSRSLDVTSRLNAQIRGEQLNLRVNNQSMGGDPAPGQPKTLTVNFTLDGKNGQRVVREGDSLHLTHGDANQGALEITRATYGSAYRNSDVTTRLNSQISGNQLHLQVNSNSMGGDPDPGQSKVLKVDYTLRGQTNQVTIQDGGMLRLNSSTQNNLQINRASYGSGYRSTDVTARLNSQIQGNQINLVVNNNTMGSDPAPNQAKTLTVQYAVNGQTNQVVVNEGDTLRLNGSSQDSPTQNNLQINRASYGSGYRSTDVTSRLNSQIQGNQINLVVNNNTMGSDPAPNQAKTLTVQYAVNGQTNQVVVNEGDTLRLNSSSPDSQNNLQINRASYGSGYRSTDVTSRLNSQIQGNQINLVVNNNTMGSDPAPNQAKTLTVQYAVNGKTNQVVVNEGDTLRLNAGTVTSELAQRFRCESVQSNNYGRKYCATNTRNEVRFLRQIGDAACNQGSSWGYDNSGVWVDQGCRAEFEIQGSGRITGSTVPSTIQNGTELSIRTNELIDSNNTNSGQTFSAVVAADVLDSAGTVIIPRGSDARLVVRSMNSGGVTSSSELILDVDSLTVNGTRYTVSTTDLDQQGGQAVGANRKTAIMVGGGAAIGTIIGAIVGGAKGAAIGAAIGAGGGLGTEVLTRGKQIRVPAETVLNFRLDQDLRLQASR